ncbi:MAG: hypothetical protein ABRQ38_10135 [Candidatus Eremiobacterota bacterium]
MIQYNSQNVFELLFGEHKDEICSDAGLLARERIKQNRVKAAQENVMHAEKIFAGNLSEAGAYELGECYHQLLDICSDREYLSQRKHIKRKLFRLLKWMDQNGIELGVASEMLLSLQIEAYYDGGWDNDTGI